MRDMLRSTFTWRLVGGFVLGTAGMLAVHAASATDAAPAVPAAIHAVR
ncbi:MAG: hypothetical protein ABIS14_03975 [Sphingomonas sp.]